MSDAPWLGAPIGGDGPIIDRAPPQAHEAGAHVVGRGGPVPPVPRLLVWPTRDGKGYQWSLATEGREIGSSAYSFEDALEDAAKVAVAHGIR